MTRTSTAFLFNEACDVIRMNTTQGGMGLIPMQGGHLTAQNFIAGEILAYRYPSRWALRGEQEPFCKLLRAVIYISVPRPL